MVDPQELQRNFNLYKTNRKNHLYCSILYCPPLLTPFYTPSLVLWVFDGGGRGHGTSVFVTKI